jgi:Lrp/AsnC family leucine-responsive transcriptional regulator
MPTFTNARVFDGRKMLPGMHTVVVEGNRIASVSESPASGEAIDLGGMTLMPGLITCHFHPDFYKFTLAMGVAGEPLGKELPPGVLMAIAVRNCGVLLESGFTGYVGAAVGLSPSAVNERIRRLLAQGTIRRFTVELDPAALGLPTLAFVWIALREDADEQAFRDHAADHPAILECHHMTGAWSYLVKLRTAGMAEIEGFLAGLKSAGFLGRSETVLALSSPVAGAHLLKAEP